MIGQWSKKITGTKLLKSCPDYPIGIFDLETDAIGSKNPTIRGIGYRWGEMLEPVLTNDLDAFWEALWDSVEKSGPGKMKAVRWYAHNGGEYDFKFLLRAWSDKLLNDDYETEPTFGGGEKCIHLKITRKDKMELHLYDSFALMPIGLEKLAKSFGGTRKLTGTIDWNKERFTLANPLHREYLKHDIDALWDIILGYRKMIWQHFGIDHGYSASGTAYKAWRCTIPKGEIYWRPSDEAATWMRNAYYGGIVRCSDIAIHQNVAMWDRNSMYPSEYRKPMPVGAPIGVDRFEPHYWGIYRVEVKAPTAKQCEDMLLGVPLRTKTGVIYPRGEFKTYITSEEYQWGIEHGYQFKVLEGMIWIENKPIFNEFVTACEILRREDYSGPIGLIAKIMQNSLYGKFGTKPLISRVIFAQERPEESWVEYIDLAGFEHRGLWTHEEKIEAAYLQPQWAVCTTARARLSLLRMIESVKEGFIYADTDSVKFEKEKVLDYENLKRRWLGPDYGQWKDEGTASRFRAIAPKVYYALLDTASILRSKKFSKAKFDKLFLSSRGENYSVNLPSTPILHAKGVPDKMVSCAMLDGIANGENHSITYIQHCSTRRVMRGEEFWIAASRRITRPNQVIAWKLEGTYYKAIVV